MTLCSYILVGIRVERPASNEAAIKYFLLGSFASAVLVYGISLTYGVTGTTDFAGIASALSKHGSGSNLLLLAAIGLVAAGLAFKIAAVPMDALAPGGFSGRTAPVPGLFSAGPQPLVPPALGRG